MPTCPRFNVTNGSIFPERVLCSWISCIASRLGLSVNKQISDCIRASASAAMRPASRTSNLRELRWLFFSQIVGHQLGAAFDKFLIRFGERVCEIAFDVQFGGQLLFHVNWHDNFGFHKI